MNIFLDIIGCRLNQSEIEGFANTFRALGHQIVSDPAEADVAIVNTCAVTVKAAADSRKKLRRAGRKGAPDVVATGCWASLYPQAAKNLAGVTKVITNEQKNDLVSQVLGISPDALAKLDWLREPLPGDRARTRAFIKVQEGCDNHCTYCLTRLARGRSRSRSFEEIQQDVEAALNGGVKEIVLTGVQLGAWGKDLNKPRSLDYLLAEILSIRDIQRLRLSSIEPWDFHPEWLGLWEDERLCRHLHIPLQSGSDAILKRMGRPIRIAQYLDLVEVIRQKVPEIAITTDVITGFPGESEDQFEETIKICQQIGFAAGHVFTYSPRPGTPAFQMVDQVPVQDAKSRNARLRDVFEVLGYQYRNQFISQKMNVLWESSEQLEDLQWQLSGLTDNYIRVKTKASHDFSNKITPVLLESHHKSEGALIGRIVDSIK